jgi:hypothetical protein
VLTAGLLPRDEYDPFTIVTSGGVTVYGEQSLTVNGLMFNITSSGAVSNIGYNEFLSFEQTEAYALRKGVSAFYRPQDPLDFTFRNTYLLNDPATAQISGATPVQDTNEQPGQPCFVVGITGGTSSSTFLLEMILHVEYTTGPFVSAVVNTGRGSLTADQCQFAAERVFGSATNVVREGISTVFNAAIRGAAGVGSAAFGNMANRASNYFSSTDNAQTITRGIGRLALWDGP